jgi:hypothetical protein
VLNSRWVSLLGLLSAVVYVVQATELVATVGFLVEKFKYGNVNFTMFDSQKQSKRQQLLYTAGDRGQCLPSG